MKTYTFHQDPGHGWLEVPVTDLQELGLSIGDFTKYSYRRGENVYLEEDLDAGVFVNAYEAMHGQEVKYRSQYTDYDSPIRSYARLPGYSPE